MNVCLGSSCFLFFRLRFSPRFSPFRCGLLLSQDAQADELSEKLHQAKALEAGANGGAKAVVNLEGPGSTGGEGDNVASRTLNTVLFAAP